MTEPATLEAELSAAEAAAAEAWTKWEKAAPQDKNAFCKRYKDVQGGVESLREQISFHGASIHRVHCLLV